MMTKLTIFVEFPPNPSPQREAELRRAVADVREAFEAIGGKVIKADLTKEGE